ncbi:uncharacterized protein LOC134241971 [Saccostrea cucullata]|uniref:uncharacterized protein LOC134241971 n=1 Tax=Saccostrea cuccullata TaxID=36930 RepID=UPI002ED33594
MAFEIDYNEVLDFGEEAVKSVDEKMKILRFAYNWADVVVPKEEKQETKIAAKKRDPQIMLKHTHKKRMREIEDKRKHQLKLDQVHEELLKVFNAKGKEKERTQGRDPQKILKYKHKILMKNIELKQTTNTLILGTYREILVRKQRISL